jgi:hypothetical protein
MRLVLAYCTLLWLGAGAASPSPKTDPPICIHPENPKYFLFRGKPLVLVTASEHYGSVINRAFDYEKYLADAADKRMTLTRTFLLYRELQTPRNPSSPCKPESPDYLTPYPRTGPGKAKDGEPAFDLDHWNEEYFDRLRRFLRSASERGIVVELTLFSHLYRDTIWSLSPLHAANNKQGIGKGEWHEFDTLRDKALVARQAAYVRKIVQETCAFDNVYYEVCNEPAGGRPRHPTVAEVDAWLIAMAGVARDELKKRGRGHLVFGTQAFDAGKLRQDLDAALGGTTWDAANIHPHPFLFWKGREYNMGGFMAKDLTLKAVRDFCVALYPQRKPVVLDEDNAASLYRDPTGWTIHRKRAWTAVLSGGHYDYIDFSVTVGSEAGTPASRQGIRLWMKHLSTVIHSFDFIHARPWPSGIECKSKHVVASVLAVDGKDYIAYLADAREVADPDAGQPIGGRIAVAVPAGSYRVTWYAPSTGVSTPGKSCEGGKKVSVDLPSFRHDVVMRVTRTR